MLKILISLVLFIYVTESAKLPKHWKVCKKNEPNMDECLREAMEFAVHDISDGNPTFGVLPLEPLRISSLTIVQGHGPISINISFKDLDVAGHKSMKLLSVKNDWKKMEIKARIPFLKLTGKYKMEGKILTLPIVGEGDFSIESDNYLPTAHLTLKKYKKNGKDYYQVDTYILLSSAETGKVHFDNLFNGDKTLGDTMNRFLNENWKEILNEINPAFSKAFGSVHKDIANKILSKVAIDDLLL